MSYIITPSDGLSNPLTEDLDAGDNNITDVGTLTASIGDMTNVSIANQIAHTDPLGTVGFYGVEPTNQAPPVPPLFGHGEVGDAVNQIVSALQALGLMA